MLETLDLARRFREQGLGEQAEKFEEIAKAAGTPDSLRLNQIRNGEAWRLSLRGDFIETRPTIGVKAYEFINRNRGKIRRLGTGTPEEQESARVEIDFPIEDDAVITAFSFLPIKLSETVYIPTKFALFVQSKGRNPDIKKIVRPGVFGRMGILGENRTGGVMNINPLDSDFGKISFVEFSEMMERTIILPDRPIKGYSEHTVGEIEKQLGHASNVLLDNLSNSSYFQGSPAE